MMKKFEIKDGFTYAPDAYMFVDKAIKMALANLKQSRHLSAYEVLISCRNLAIQDYGFLASEVLRSWGIQSSKDIGEIVYQMIRNNILSASAEDKQSDFEIQFELFENTSPKNPVSPRKVHDPIICD